MSAPCCVGTKRDASDCKGVESKLGDLDLYTVNPGEGKANGLGVIVVHDIFGWSIPNSRWIADYFACHGFVSVCPDLYHGDAWDASKGMGPDSGFGEWFGPKMAPDYVAGVIADVQRTAEHMKSQGVSNVGVIGFCWGGAIAMKLASTDFISASVSCHGVGMTPDVVANAQCPLLLVVSAIDAYCGPDDVQKIHQAFRDNATKIGRIEVFAQCEHGFVNRGNYDSEEGAWQSLQALGHSAEWFQHYMKKE